MNRPEFVAFAKEKLEAAVKLLEAKADEYERTSFDSNFIRAGKLEGCTPEHALRGMLSKHIVSIYDMIDDLDKPVTHPLSMWQEKITDIINYCLILLAMQSNKAVFTWKSVTVDIGTTPICPDPWDLPMKEVDIVETRH